MTIDEEEQFYEAEGEAEDTINHIDKQSNGWTDKVPADSDKQPRLGATARHFDDHIYTNLSDSLSSLYLPTVSPHLRHLASTIMSGLNWINQFELNQSSLLQYINTINPFRRRSSGLMLGNNKNNNNNNNNNSSDNNRDPVDAVSSSSNINSNTLFTKSFASILNQRAAKTLKSTEVIELSDFGLVDVENIESGIGHEFTIYENDKPTWCDSCYEFLSTPVMINTSSKTSKSAAKTSEEEKKAGEDVGNQSLATTTTAPTAVQVDQIMRTYLQCQKCKYVCHPGCVQSIRINCAGTSSRKEKIQSKSASTITETVTSTQQQLQEVEQETNQTVQEQHNFDSNNNNSAGSSRSNSMDDNHSTSQATTSTTTTTTSSFDESVAISLSSSTDVEPIETATAATTTTSAVASSSADNNGREGVEVTHETMGNNLSEQEQLINETSANIVVSNIVEDAKSANNNNNNVDSTSEAMMLTPAGPAQTITPKVIVNLKGKICRYNERLRGKGSGLGITLIDEPGQLFRGFLRVHMNLTRPINVVSGKRPPSIYDIINEQNEEKQSNQRRTLTSFYMPRDTVKNIHIDSANTSLQVIKAMLKKFKVVDNPQKFALYLRRRMLVDETKIDAANEDGGSKDADSGADFEAMSLATIKTFLSRSCSDHSLRRLSDSERPLVLQLEFDSYSYGAVDIVLQENDNADIAWDAFKIPELHNFLRILDREEGEHLRHVKAHYEELKYVLKTAIEWRERETKGLDTAAGEGVLV